MLNALIDASPGANVAMTAMRYGLTYLNDIIQDAYLRLSFGCFSETLATFSLNRGYAAAHGLRWDTSHAFSYLSVIPIVTVASNTASISRRALGHLLDTWSPRDLRVTDGRLPGARGCLLGMEIAWCKITCEQNYA